MTLLQLFIKGYNYNQETFILEIDPNMIYSELKNKISLLTNIQLNNFQLIYGTKYIEFKNIYDNTLEQIGITNIATLYIKLHHIDR